MVPGLRHRLAAEQIGQRRGHLRDDVPDLADPAFGDQPMGGLDDRLEVPAIGQHDRRPCRSAAATSARASAAVVAIGFSINVGRPLPAPLSVLGVQDMRRGHDHPVERLGGQHRRGILVRNDTGKRSTTCARPFASGRMTATRPTCGFARSAGMWESVAHQPAPITPISTLSFMAAPRGLRSIRAPADAAAGPQGGQRCRWPPAPAAGRSPGRSTRRRAG